MGKVNLNVRESVNRPILDPVELENGIVINLSATKRGESMELRAEAKKGNQNIGSASFSSENQRFFIQVYPFGEMSTNEAYDLGETLMDCIKKMIELE